MSHIISTTLNPLFSEERIAHQAKSVKQSIADEESQKNLVKIETEEIKKHDKNGGNKNNFKPSDDLKRAILDNCITIVRLRNIKANYEKMIEANIAILNGKTISEVEEAYYDNEKDEFLFGNENETEVQELYKDWLKNRTGYWKEYWDKILQGKLAE